MPFFINRGFPPRFTQEEKQRISRYCGVGIWVGVFCSLTIVFWMWPKLSEVPGLPLRVLIAVGGLSLIEAIVGYLLFAGTLVSQ